MTFARLVWFSLTSHQVLSINSIPTSWPNGWLIIGSSAVMELLSKQDGIRRLIRPVLGKWPGSSEGAWRPGVLMVVPRGYLWASPSPPPESLIRLEYTYKRSTHGSHSAKYERLFGPISFWRAHL